MDAKAVTVIGAVALFGAGGYFAVDALPGTEGMSVGVVTMTRIVRGKVVYRTIGGRVETLPARSNYATLTQPSGIVAVAARTIYATVTQPSGIVAVAARGKPVTTEITRTVTVNQRQLVTHLVTHQQTVTVQQTVTAGGRMVTNESTVTQPVTQVSTSTVAVTTIVPVATTVSVTTMLPASTVTRTVTATTPGPTMTVVVSPTMTLTVPLGG
jgi:hypothetical protein